MEKILVSIILISYNAEKYIVEALDSVKNQTYKNIELIISDDASTDNTNNIIEQWLLKNKKLQLKHKYVKNHKNKGITANLNQAVKMASGEYIKLLASDDILYNNAIEVLLKFVLTNNLDFCFSNVLPFSNSKDKDIIRIIKNDSRNSKRFFGKNIKQQYRSMLILTTPLTFTLGAFYKRTIIEELGYYDEDYSMQEDYSFALKLAKLGKKFEKVDTLTYKYRLRLEIDHEYKKSKRYIEGYKCMKKIRENYVLNEVKKEKMFFSFLYLKFTMFILDLEFRNNSVLFDRIAKIGRKVKQFMMMFYN